jgi:hypothetical protein
VTPAAAARWAAPPAAQETTPALQDSLESVVLTPELPDKLARRVQAPRAR